MTIFTNTRSFTGYRFTAIEPKALERLQSASESLGPNSARSFWPVMLRLECYLQITGDSLRDIHIGTPRGTRIFRGFIGALYSARFDSKSANIFVSASRLRSFLAKLGDQKTFEGFGIPTERQVAIEKPLQKQIRSFEAKTLLADRVHFWRGWTIENKIGLQTHLRLYGIYEKYGAEFTDQFLIACNEYFRGTRGNTIVGVNEFAEFLSHPERQHSPQDFEDPEFVSDLFVEFFAWYHIELFERKVRVSTISSDWGNFVVFATKYLFGKIWAKPIRAIPRPEVKAVSGFKTNIKSSADGSSVQFSLLTEVPLQVSDADAKDILFGSIRADVSMLLTWARAEIALFLRRCERRKELAGSGIVSVLNKTGERNGQKERVRLDCPDWLAHASATFETYGFSANAMSYARKFYPQPLADTAWELGVPTSALLLAFGTLLVATHPQITSSFIRHLEVFDSNGRPCGILRKDAGTYLQGYKPRRGTKKAQQDVLLNNETTAAVELLLAVTQPLRDSMRAAGSPHWRRLFLCAASLGRMPQSWRPDNAVANEKEWLAERLENLAECSRTEATSLANRFSLKRLRASAGVLVYLETGSVLKMAEALGHDRFNPTLLDHYLPKPIQEFFVHRWIALFQQGFICEALAGSPFLLRATSFKTIKELDEFLEKHALKKLPLHLEDPEHLQKTPPIEKPHSKVIFGLDAGILTQLISLERAVNSALALGKRHPCGRAVRWAQISSKLSVHLKSQGTQPEFKLMLKSAEANADPARMEHLIYG